MKGKERGGACTNECVWDNKKERKRNREIARNNKNAIEQWV